MEEIVVGALLGVTMQGFFQKFFSTSMKEIDLIRGFKNELEKLKDTSLMIEDVLRDVKMQQITNRAVQRWLKKLEVVAFEANHVLDEFNNELHSESMPTFTKMKKEVQLFLISSYYNSRRKNARKIKNIYKKLELINQEASSFGLQFRFAGTHASGATSDIQSGLESDSFTVDPIFVETEFEVQKIVEMLTASSTDEQVQHVLPIVGMSVLGNRALAKRVYDDQKITSRFERRVWVHVSEFGLTSLLKSIVTSLKAENVEHENTESLLEKLAEELRTKRYLLVLDDLRNEQKEELKNLVSSLSACGTSTNGNVIEERALEEGDDLFCGLRYSVCLPLIDNWLSVKED